MEKPDAKVTLCDFKHDDFRFLDGHDRYYSFTDCANGLDRFYREFQARQSGEDNSRDFRLLLFDEWASYLNMIPDKKVITAEQMKLATLLMLGRSFKCFVLISQQVFYAKYFEGARENFSNILNLGNPSFEAAHIWGFDRDQLLPAREAGAGHILINGEQIPFQAPMVRDFQKLDDAIRKLVQ